MNERKHSEPNWTKLQTVTACVGVAGFLSTFIGLGTWFFNIPFRVGVLEGTVKSNSEWRYRHELESAAGGGQLHHLEERLAECEKRLLDTSKLKP